MMQADGTMDQHDAAGRDYPPAWVVSGSLTCGFACSSDSDNFFIGKLLDLRWSGGTLLMNGFPGWRFKTLSFLVVIA